MGECDIAPAAGPAPRVVTMVMVLRAFREVSLPESRIVVQPPGGTTLVNFDTLFRTEAEPFTRSVTLLGSRVDLRIEADSFLWHAGDGESFSTDDPGREFRRGLPMDAYVSHVYEDAKVIVHPSVDTTWSAQYRIDGGPWAPVNGTVTMEGETASLRVAEGVPRLVSPYE